MKKLSTVLSIVMIAFIISSGLSVSEEGMWTFDNPPVKEVKEKYNFVMTQDWLDHLRLSAVKFYNGTGAFISGNGLLMTNFHVAHDHLDRMSKDGYDYLGKGFYASSIEKEVKCPGLTAKVLIKTENVSDRINQIDRNGISDEEYEAKVKKELDKIKDEAYNDGELKPEIIKLYHGSEYWVYFYKVYEDIRLVMSPEKNAALFGGLFYDNFTYPRYCLDMTFLRAYENDMPVKPEHYFKFNVKGAKENDLVFISGNPAGTNRNETKAEIEYARDYSYPKILSGMKARKKSLMTQKNGKEDGSGFESKMLEIDNGMKIMEGALEGLNKKSIMDKKAAEEADLMRLINKDPLLKEKYGFVLNNISKLINEKINRSKELNNRNLGKSMLGLFAEFIVKNAHEEQRQKEGLPLTVKARALYMYKFYTQSEHEIDMEEQKETMIKEWNNNIDALGKDDIYVQTLLKGRTVKEVVNDLFKNTRLDDQDFRKKLIEGGLDSVTACKDPFIMLAEELDPIVFEDRNWEMNVYERELEIEKKKLDRARYEVYSDSRPPDATFTLRLSFGTVKGYMANGTLFPWHTTLYGLFDRCLSFDNDGDYELPKRYFDNKDDLKLNTFVNFVTTNDIIGGNSGSSILNTDGEVVGLVFDGNYQSISGKYIFDDDHARTLCVHSAYIIEALRNLYGAGKLADEILGK